MSAPFKQNAALSSMAMSAIRGSIDAQRLLHSINQGMAPADALLEGTQAVMAAGDAERLRAFFREVQKRLERVA